jgi:DNA-binding NarL/FixJ family response regulator
MTRKRRNEITAHDLEVIHLVVEGNSNKEIAAKIFRSKQAVGWRLRTIYNKCGIGWGAGARLKLVAFAFRHGLVK